MPAQVSKDFLMNCEQKTMIRSLDTVAENSRGKPSYFKSAPFEDEFQGWGPEVQIIEEAELKKIEKQEDRDARMKKRRAR
jgi:hypothetical protein